MRFMVMHKMTDELEAGGPPDEEIIAGVDKLIEEGLEKKVFVSGEGLKPTKERTYLEYQGGKRKLIDGPFTESKELVGGFAVLRVRSKEEAIEWCDRFAETIGDVKLYLGPIVEAWDLGMGERPPHAPLRFLSVMQADPAKDDDTPPDPAEIAKMGALIGEMQAAGVLQDTGGLASTKKGARIRFSGKKHTVIDGPFAESKELISGYSILDLPSKDAAIEWAVRFGHIVRVNEVEVRQLPEWA